MTANPHGPEYMSVLEAAEQLGVTRRTVDNYIRQGWLPAFRGLGRRTWVRRADVEQLRRPVPIDQAERRRSGRPHKVTPPGLSVGPTTKTAG
jgi:excisionase family DNA binding protein